MGTPCTDRWIDSFWITISEVLGVGQFRTNPSRSPPEQGSVSRVIQRYRRPVKIMEGREPAGAGVKLLQMAHDSVFSRMYLVIPGQ